ncbi:MAG: FixH family protein, partial [Hyphomicrobiaceae bacterium]|nr:FixH family protein [Hyphomicrobiaceae bacterium]
MAEGEQVSRGGLRGIHVLAIFLGFFGVVFAVNGVFLYQALSTHTGVVSRQPYRKGLEYNSRIADAERQQKLGWRDDLSYRREAGMLVVKITDKGGSPVTGLYVSGIIGRPSTAQQDTT